MDTNTPRTENPIHLHVDNCQYVFIGDNNVINSSNTKVEGTLAEKNEQRNKKGTFNHPDKPFHVSQIRRKELNGIESLFSDMIDDLHKDVVRTVYLTGPPGAGKTELARQYGDLFSKATFSNDLSTYLVITLNANSEESLVKSAKEVIRQLQLFTEVDSTNNNLDDLMKKLRDYLHSVSGAWLLIVDDMFETNVFNNLFPRPGNEKWGGGQVLVTTQDNNVVPACHQFAKKYSLNEGMTKEDALALLTEISKVEADDFTEETIEELHYLPLALACCATYVGETRQDRASTKFGWKDYLNLYRENTKLESRTFSKNNSVYPFSMTTAATMAVKRMVQNSDVLRQTFSFLSYCALLPVPLIILAHHVSATLSVRNGKHPTIKEIENEISRCSLLIHGRLQNVETMKCHQVIYHAFQSVEGTRFTEEREIEFVKMMKSLNETLDFMDNTSKEDVLLKVLARPHLQLFIDHANDMSWNNTGEFFLITMKNSQFLFLSSDMPNEKAVESLESLYNIFLELDMSDERRCDILANIGFYYLELECNEDAVNFLSKAFLMTEGRSGHAWLVLRCKISFTLAKAYCMADNIGVGVQMMRGSIELAKKVFVKEEQKIMSRFSNLAHFYLTWGKFWKIGEVVDEAAKYFTSCTPSCVSLSRARCLSDLSRVYVRSAFFDSIFRPWMFRKHVNLAEVILNQSLDIYEQVFGTEVSSCSKYCSLLLLSVLLKLEAQPTEARSQLEKALAICIQSDDKFTRYMAVLWKKHLLEDLSAQPTWHCWFTWIRNVSRGHLKFSAAINICDDILNDYKAGKISPSRRRIHSIKTARTFMAWYNYAWIFLLFWGFLSIFCILRYFVL